MLDVRSGMYSSACTVVLVNSGPSLPAERYEELRGAVQKKRDSSCLCVVLNPNKLILCSSYCLGKPAMLFSFPSFFLLFSLPPLSSFLAISLTLPALACPSPPFANSCELQRQTFVQGLACLAVDYLRWRTVQYASCCPGHWPLRQLQLNSPWCAPLLAAAEQFGVCGWRPHFWQWCRTIWTRWRRLTAVYCSAEKALAVG